MSPTPAWVWRQFPERVDGPCNARGLCELIHGARIIVGWRDDLEGEPCPGSVPLDPLHGAEESAACDADTLPDLRLPTGRDIMHGRPPCSMVAGRVISAPP